MPGVRCHDAIRLTWVKVAFMSSLCRRRWTTLHSLGTTSVSVCVANVSPWPTYGTDSSRASATAHITMFDHQERIQPVAARLAGQTILTRTGR